MSYYFVAQIEIHDEKEYQKYLKDVDAVFSKFDGKYLALDEKPIILEGSRPCGRVALIEFPNEEGFKRWYESSEYQAILKYRLKAAACNSILVKGKS